MGARKEGMRFTLDDLSDTNAGLEVAATDGRVESVWVVFSCFSFRS